MRDIYKQKDKDENVNTEDQTEDVGNIALFLVTDNPITKYFASDWAFYFR